METQEDHVNELGEEGESGVVTTACERRGDVEKCPVCGSRVDADAYHCPACHSFFCFHCRARLLPADTQLQCVNQQCDYYGKLVCDVCDSAAEQEEPPTVYAEPEDGYWPAWLAFALLITPLIWYFTSIFVAVSSAVVIFAGGGLFLQQLGINIFGRENRVERPRWSTYHTCIRCRKPVKKVQGG